MNSEPITENNQHLPTSILGKDLDSSEELASFSTKNEKLTSESSSFEEVLAWFEAKGIEAGNPETIHDDFSHKQKQSLRLINNQGERNSQSSVLLGKRKMGNIGLSSLTISL